MAPFGGFRHRQLFQMINVQHKFAMHAPRSIAAPLPPTALAQHQQARGTRSKNVEGTVPVGMVRGVTAVRVRAGNTKHIRCLKAPHVGKHNVLSWGHTNTGGAGPTTPTHIFMVVKHSKTDQERLTQNVVMGRTGKTLCGPGVDAMWEYMCNTSEMHDITPLFVTQHEPLSYS